MHIGEQRAGGAGRDGGDGGDALNLTGPARPVLTPAGLAALMGALAGAGFRVRTGPPRGLCVRCLKAIPPGKAGRACRECRGL